MSHPDDAYTPAPGNEGLPPADLATAHVAHDHQVWTDAGEFVCDCANFETAKLIARLLREASQDAASHDPGKAPEGVQEQGEIR